MTMDRTVCRLTLGLLLPLVTAGCGILGPSVCTLDVRPAIRVEVLDSISGDPVRGTMQIVARGGSATFEVDPNQFFFPPGVDPDTIAFGPFHLAQERAGTYSVAVEAEGYRPWQRDAVRVRDDACHVRTVELTARLQPALDG